MTNELKKEIQSMIDQLESEESFTIQTANGDTWEIGASDCWIGGYFVGDEVGCDYLGNVIYSKSSLLNNLINELDSEIIEANY